MRGQEQQQLRQREIRWAGYEIRQVFCSPQPRGFTASKNMKMVVFNCLFDDDKELSDPIDRSPVRSGFRFLMTFIIGVNCNMRVTNVTLDYSTRKNANTYI